MIIKAKSRAGGRALGVYLSTQGKNERVQLLETRGTVATDALGAILEMDAYALGTRCEKPLYHAMVSPEPPYRLTPEQRVESVDALEAELGLSGHARVLVLHEHLGREHLHIVWSRIDLERMRSVSDSHNYRRHEIVARDLERRFGHPRVQGAHHERENVQRPGRTASRAELRQEERTGIKGRDVKAEVTSIFRGSDGAESFRAGLEDRGYLLARGDRRDFVIVDRHGGTHNLARRLDGLKAADLREFMQPIDPATVPSVEGAKALHLQRANEPRSVERELVWEDELGASAIERAIRGAEEETLRARQQRAARTEARADAAFARGDDYVTQSHAAQRLHRQRQEELDEIAGRDPLWDRIEAGETRQEQHADEEGQLHERYGLVDDGQESEVLLTLADTPGIELSEDPSGRIDRLLGGGSQSHGREDPDRQREVPGRGQTRSR